MRCDPRDITAVLRVTFAKDGDHAPDNLRWVLEGGATVIGISRDVPTFMLWGCAAVDHWLVHTATDEDRSVLHKGGGGDWRMALTGNIKGLRTRAAAAADRGRAPGLKTDTDLAKDSHLAARLVGHAPTQAPIDAPRTPTKAPTSPPPSKAPTTQPPTKAPTEPPQEAP
eukprot:gene38240-57111_t